MSNSPEPLLRVQDLRVAFAGEPGPREIVHGVSFSIGRGETLALVGESGSGKSVTALSVMQLLPYPAASHGAGSSIRFDGQELVGSGEAAMRALRGRRIGMIFQEPLTALNPLHTVYKQIAETISLHRAAGRAQVKARVLELLDLVGLSALKDRLNAYPHELSGGQRQRVMIAMAIANDPDLLIADEPTTALDVTVQAQILDLLQSLKDRFGMALLIITHDLGVVSRIAGRVCVMKDGAIVEAGVAAELFFAPRHPYTKMLLAAQPRARTDRAAPGTPVLLRADDLKVWFPRETTLFGGVRDHVKAVDGVSLAVHRGRTLGIVGESGSGKSTLGYALLRLAPLTAGTIVFDGTDISRFNRKQMRPYRRRMQIVFQDPFGSLSPRLSVEQIIGEGLAIHEPALTRPEREHRVALAMQDVGLDPSNRHRFPHEFSGGQRQRIAISRAMVLKPDFVVLDEPSSALDVSVQAQIVDLLRDLQDKYGLTYIFISHDLKVVRAMAHDLIVMRHGRIVESGPADVVFNAPEQDYTKTLLSAALTVRHAAA